METLTGVRFPVGIGRAARGVRSGYSLQFSDKLVVPSQKKQKKGCDTPMERSVDALRDGRRRTTWAAGKSHRGGRTRREQERIRIAYRRFTRVGSVPSSDRSMPTVPHVLAHL